MLGPECITRALRGALVFFGTKIEFRLFSQNLWKAAHSEHHEQRDCQTGTNGILQMPGRYVLHRGLH